MSRPSTAKLSVLIVALALLSSRGAAASTIAYSTTGSVFPWTYGNGAASGITGTNVVSFDGISNASTQGPGVFSLGSFVVAAPTPGTTTTYQNAEFLLELKTNTGPTSSASGNVVPYSTIDITGVLNGTVDGSGNSSLLASVKSIEPAAMLIPASGNSPVSQFDPPFPLPALNIPQPIALATTPGGRTTLVAQVTAVPEPALSAFFAALAGFAWIRRSQKGLRRNRPVVARTPAHGGRPQHLRLNPFVVPET